MQLSLPIQPQNDDTLANFYGGNNLLLLNSLRQNFTELKQPFFYIWGSQGCGKSHLLRALTNHYFAENRTALYVPLDKSAYFSPAVLDNLEQNELVCLDNLQCVLGDSEWELALFDLFNRIKEHGNCLLVLSADQSPNAIQVNLPDLATRLRWGEIYQLYALDEQQKITALQQNARERGIELPDETANFLLKRLDRDMHTLFNALTQLDNASLQAQRKLTIPFVKEILKL